MAFHDFYKGLATSPLNSPIRDDDARAIEKLLDGGDYSPFHKFSANLDSFAPGERADISVISDDSVDGDKEVFDPKTFDFSRFQKNPIVAYGHNYKIPPIGKSLWQKLVNNSWKAKSQYATKPEGHPSDKEWFPDSIYSLVRDGFLPGKSIGGIAKFREITPEDIQKNPHWAGGKKVTTNVQVIEYSVVPVQCNKNAIVEAVNKGLYIPEEIISTDFPELYEFIKQQKQVPVIKDYTTLDDYIAAERDSMNKKILEQAAGLPQLVQDKIDIALGRV